MCKNIFAHEWREQSIAMAREIAIIGLYVGYSGIFSVIQGKRELDAVPGMCIIIFTFISR